MADKGLRPIVVFHPSPHMVRAVDDMFAELAPAGLEVRNLIRSDMLDRAAGSITADLREEVDELIAGIQETNPVIVCSCSTYGSYSEEVGQARGKQVLRIDRPMAERAVQLGRNIGLVAAVRSTLGPSRELLEVVAAEASATIAITEIVLDDAWRRKLAGDQDGYFAAVVEGARQNAQGLDVIVLAQATMAPAADKLADLGVPVLSSTRLGVLRAIELASQPQPDA